MSRSYHYTPIVKDNGKHKRWAKNQANRRVRRNKHTIANGKAYRKLYCSWGICDWINYWPKNEALHSYHRHPDWWAEEYPTETDFIDKYWKPLFYWK